MFAGVHLDQAIMDVTWQKAFVLVFLVLLQVTSRRKKNVDLT